MRYRPDIDGLRAVAVTAIVLFHLGVPFFPGGFVGVDIFFVISGYLITSIIQPEIAEGRFSIVAFYERRVRRIFPALFVMMIFCTICASLFFLPSVFYDFSKSLIGCATFVSNFVFWEQSGYFDARAEIKPLLHTWSLAVEEQFYIGFPAILLLIMRFRGKFNVALTVLMLASLTLNVIIAGRYTSLAFYLIPTRAWELLLGSLIALKILPPFSSRTNAAITSIFGVALVAWGIFGLNRYDVFPGVNAIYPCLGAALLIYVGENATTIAQRWLSLRPVVMIGLISYSLYLWHWPLVVFYKYYVMRELSNLEAFVLLVICIAIAAISYSFVEQPFRNRKTIQRRAVFTISTGAATLIIAFGAFGVISKGWTKRFSPEILALDEMGRDLPNEFLPKCMSGKNIVSYENSCTYGASVTPTFALWSDSTGGELVRALGALLESRGQSIQQLTFGVCPPSLNFSLGRIDSCVRYSENILRELTTSKTIHTVFIAAHYELYIQNEDNIKRFSDGFIKAVTALAEAGKKVVVIYPIPTANDSIPRIIARNVMKGVPPESVVLDYYAFRKSNMVALDMLDSINHPNIFKVAPEKRLCAGNGCLLYANGKVLYFDDHHLSLAGAVYIAPLLIPFFDDALSSTPHVISPASSGN